MTSPAMLSYTIPLGPERDAEVRVPRDLSFDEIARIGEVLDAVFGPTMRPGSLCQVHTCARPERGSAGRSRSEPEDDVMSAPTDDDFDLPMEDEVEDDEDDEGDPPGVRTVMEERPLVPLARAITEAPPAPAKPGSAVQAPPAAGETTDEAVVLRRMLAALQTVGSRAKARTIVGENAIAWAMAQRVARTDRRFSWTTPSRGRARGDGVIERVEA